MARSDSQPDSIAAHARSQSQELRAICDKLQMEIDRALPNATSKIWHGSPVWFLNENPVAGYSVRQNGVELLFWSGQLFDEPLLKPLGKDKAARTSFQHESDLSLPNLRRWLEKSGTLLFDYVGMYRQKRRSSPATPRKRT